MPGHALGISIENATKMVYIIPLNAKNEDQMMIKVAPKLPIQCNVNYRGPSRTDFNAFRCDGYRFP